MGHAPLSRVDRRRQRTRQALLDVALVLFSERGIYWTKVEDVTDRADVAKGSFYQHFPTKEALLAELLLHGLAELAGTLESLPASGSRAGSSGDWLDTLISAELDFYLTRPEYLLFFHQIRGLVRLDRAHAKELLGIYNAHFNRVGKLVQRVAGSRALTPRRARDLGMSISAYTSGLAMHHQVFDEVSPKRNREHLLTRLTRSLHALM